MSDRGDLGTGEAHPAALLAMEWLNAVPFTEKMQWIEAFASTAIEGNRLAEVCVETLNRVIHGNPVSDRYLLGLCWVMAKEKGEIK